MANFKPQIVGGQDLTSMRAVFDDQNEHVIVPSTSELFYFKTSTCEQVGRAKINLTVPNEKVVSCDRLNQSIYLFTNQGKIIVWNMDAKDWHNQLNLPLKDGESLISCKLLSKRQYIFSVDDSNDTETSQTKKLYLAKSRSERERPKSKTFIGECSTGDLTSFDIGQFNSKLASPSKNTKLAIQQFSDERCLAYVKDYVLTMNKVTINKDFTPDPVTRSISNDVKITCVRVNPHAPMIAIGDTRGRIYLYTGQISQDGLVREKLHWHSLPVNDLCFSSTGLTLYSVGGESGCLVIWSLGHNEVGNKRVIARLGMPMRTISCANHSNQILLGSENNELQIIAPDGSTKKFNTFTKDTSEIFLKNDPRALRSNSSAASNPVGLLWYQYSDTVVTNSMNGWLQFYSPKLQTRSRDINFLRSNTLSLEPNAKVRPSEITKAAISLDGFWIAIFETQKSSLSFPDVKLHLWKRSRAQNFGWIQTIDRLHTALEIVDLKFSPDGFFLISVCQDGTFHVLHRISFDGYNHETSRESRSKSMYAKGYSGRVRADLPAKVAFSQDSSVMAMSLKNETISIWMIVDPFKLVFECQLNHLSADIAVDTADTPESIASYEVIGLNFGYHRPSEGLAPLCEIRSNCIRIWNILNPCETLEYPATELGPDGDKFVASTFDRTGQNELRNHFAVCTGKSLILIFKLEMTQPSGKLSPLIIIDANLPNHIGTPQYTDMCFMQKPILEIHQNSHADENLMKLVNRLCLMTSSKELVAMTDQLTLDGQSASNSCNEIKTYDVNELQAYFVKSQQTFKMEVPDGGPTSIDQQAITEKQKRIRNRQEVQKMLKDVILRIPSQNLPHIEVLGKMILDKLVS